jgi:uncharacterized protein
METKKRRTENLGFASMDPVKQKEIARKGGQSISKNKEHMSRIGKLGVQKREQNKARQGAFTGETLPNE